MIRLNEQELRQLIQSGETNIVELKAAAPRRVEMAERLCGMANAQGGVIIIGVEDAKQKIIGVPDDRLAMTIDTVLRAARQNVKPALVLEPPKPETYEVDGKRLVVPAVPPSRGPVYQSSGVFWVRRGTRTVPLDASELIELMGDRGPLEWERHAAPRFRETGEFIVTFQKAPELMSPQVRPQSQETLWGDDGLIQPKVPGPDIPDEREERLRKAIGYVHEHGSIANKVYRELTGISDRTAHRDLELLLERGRLRGVGQRAARRYVLAQ